MPVFNGTDNGELISGSSGDDTINGLGGNDVLQGLAGNDSLNGGSGNDTLTGGPGIDTLTGGPGSDTFRDTASGLNGDTITDFSVGDRIQITDLTQATANIHINGDVITFAGGSVNVTGLSSVAGRIAIRDVLGGGVEIRLQPLAHNDFNGDGVSDILWQNDNGQLTDWLGTATTGSFATNWANANLHIPANSTIVGTGDFNADGHVDILLRDSGGTITDWLGNANGGFTSNDANASSFVPTSWSVAGTGDFNGDGHDDILWRDSSGALTDWLGTANGGFTSNWANAGTNVPTDWTVVGTGDFNGDGRTDVLWRNSAGVVTDWLSTESGGFNPNWANASFGVPVSWTIAGTGDFNGDGITDVLWRNSDGTLVDWLGDSNGGFSANWANAPTGVGSEWKIAEIGDFNGDGVDDILWRNTNGQVTEWLGNANGNGGFTDNSAHASTSLATSWHVEPDHLV